MQRLWVSDTGNLFMRAMTLWFVNVKIYPYMLNEYLKSGFVWIHCPFCYLREICALLKSPLPITPQISLYAFSSSVCAF